MKHIETFEFTNLSELKKLLREGADLTEQLERKLKEISEFEIVTDRIDPSKTHRCTHQQHLDS